MQYEALHINDDGTARVEMVINGRHLEQDFDIGKDATEFDANVRIGMAVFNDELTRNAATIVPSDITLNQVVQVLSLSTPGVN